MSGRCPDREHQHADRQSGSDRALVIDGWRSARRQRLPVEFTPRCHGWAAVHGRATRDYHHRFGPSRRHFCSSASAARTAASLTR